MGQVDDDDLDDLDDEFDEFDYLDHEENTEYNSDLSPGNAIRGIAIVFVLLAAAFHYSNANDSQEEISPPLSNNFQNSATNTEDTVVDVVAEVVGTASEVASRAIDSTSTGKTIEAKQTEGSFNLDQ